MTEKTEKLETELSKFVKEQREEKPIYCMGPDGCVYRIESLSKDAFDRRYEQR